MLSRCEAKYTPLQHAQRDFLMRAREADPCLRCGSTLKSFIGSNSYFIRVKCGQCDGLITKAPVIWPTDQRWAQQSLAEYEWPA